MSNQPAPLGEPTPLEHRGTSPAYHRVLLARVVRPIRGGDTFITEIVESRGEHNSRLELVRFRPDRPPNVFQLWASEANALAEILPAFISASRAMDVARPIVARSEAPRRAGQPRGRVAP